MFCVLAVFAADCSFGDKLYYDEKEEACLSCADAFSAPDGTRPKWDPHSGMCEEEEDSSPNCLLTDGAVEALADMVSFVCDTCGEGLFWEPYTTTCVPSSKCASEPAACGKVCGPCDETRIWDATNKKCVEECPEGSVKYDYEYQYSESGQQQTAVLSQCITAEQC